MEIWALRPHVKWVKVILCICELHVFLHQYVVDLREGRSENIFRTASISVRKQELEIGVSHVTDMTDSFHGQITVASDSQDVRELWDVMPHAIFVMMMMYTLESRRTFRADLALCDFHEFLCLNVTDIREGMSERVSGTISTSAFLLDVTVISSSGVIVSPSDVPVGQPQPLATGVSCTDTGIMATPFIVPPSPDIEQPCRQLQDSPMCRMPESRQPWLLWNLSAICFNRMFFLRSTESSAHKPPRKQPETSSSSSSIDCFRPLCRESSRPTGDALLPPPADDCLCSSVDTPDSVGHREPFQDPGLSVGEILDFCNARDPRERTGQYSLDCRVVHANTRSPAICCIQMETRHMYCCRFLFRARSPQDVWSRSGSSFGVPFTIGLCVLFRSDYFTSE